jgi:hypothetical protein
MAIEAILERHVYVLEDSVRDILDNRLSNTTYIQQTLHFLRHTVVASFLQGESREKVRRLWDSYRKLSRYAQEINPSPIDKTNQVSLNALQVSDRIALFQMQRLGISTSEAPVELTSEEQKQLRLIEEQARAERAERKKQTKPDLRTLQSNDPVTIALGAALGMDLR